MFCLDIMLPIISRGLLQIKINQKKANKAFPSICPTAVGCLGSKPASLYKINPIIEEICNYLMTSAHFGNVGCVSYHAHIRLLWAHKHEVLYKLLDGVVNIFQKLAPQWKGRDRQTIFSQQKEDTTDNTNATALQRQITPFMFGRIVQCQVVILSVHKTQ